MTLREECDSLILIPAWNDEFGPPTTGSVRVEEDPREAVYVGQGHVNNSDLWEGYISKWCVLRYKRLKISSSPEGIEIRNSVSIRVHRVRDDTGINSWETAFRAPWCVSLPILLQLIQCYLGLSRGHMDMELGCPTWNLQGLGLWQCSFKSKGNTVLPRKKKNQRQSKILWTEHSFKGEWRWWFLKFMPPKSGNCNTAIAPMDSCPDPAFLTNLPHYRFSTRGQS